MHLTEQLGVKNHLHQTTMLKMQLNCTTGSDTNKDEYKNKKKADTIDEKKNFSTLKLSARLPDSLGSP